MVAAGLLAAPAAQEPGSPGLGPGGGRGLGAETDPRAIVALFRSRDPDDVAFVAELDDLVAGVRLQLADLEAAYREAGYLALLDEDQTPGIDALYAAWERAAAHPVEILTGPELRARALARSLQDARFRVRRRLLRDWHADARDVDLGTALLRAAAWSQVVLEDVEVRAIAARVDLGASRLRALRQDLETLRQSEPAGGDAPALVELARSPDRSRALEAVAAAAARSERIANKMWASLQLPRLEPATRNLVEWRTGVLVQAAGLRREALRLHPDTGPADVPADLARLKKSERIQRALSVALAGLVLDPLDEDLTWIAAESSYYRYGGLGSRSLYGRYLALRGIRPWDYRTYQGRALTKREERALWVVQT